MESKAKTTLLTNHPFTEGTAVLERATKVVEKAKEREVRDIQVAMQPTLERAAALLKEMTALHEDHKEALDRLDRLDWNALRAYKTVPERLLMALHRNVGEARGLLRSSLDVLPKIPRRVRDLDLTDVHVRREEGIRQEVRWMEENPAAFRQKLHLIDRYLREIEASLGRDAGELREMIHIVHTPERQPRQRRAIDGMSE